MQQSFVTGSSRKGGTVHSPSFRFAISLLALSIAGSVHGAGVFGIDTDVSGVRTSASFSSVEDVFDSLKDPNLRSLNPAYTGIQAAQTAIDYRGVAVLVSYPTANLSQLVLQIPSLGVTRTFDGGARDASQQLLKDYFKQNGDDILGKLSKSLAKNSPVDPIAGNPNSLMSQLVGMDFDSAFASALDSGKAADQGRSASIGLDYAQYRQSGVDSRSYTLPLTYTFYGFDQGRQLTFKLPVSFSDAEGSKGYSVGLGASYRFPINNQWALTPSVNYIAAGSRDLGVLAGMASLALSSSYVLPFKVLDNSDLVVGNMVGYYKALRIKSGDYGYDPGISNTVIRNGILLSQPTTLGGWPLHLIFSLIDTHFFGDDLFVQHYDELGVAVSNRSIAEVRTSFGAGLNVLLSSKSKGISLKANYRF